MKSLIVIVFFLIATAYSQQVKFQEAGKTVENIADSIDNFIKKK
jgi:hypothetical protein